jgi:DNA topoisomerase IA
LQTLTFKNRIPVLATSLGKSPISFGPCQFPTLGFVVDRCGLHMVLIAFAC